MKISGQIFIKGLIAIVPITFTLYLLIWLWVTAELILGNIFKSIFPDSWYFRGLGFVLIFAVIISVGNFLESYTFSQLFHKFEKVFTSIPVIRTIYKTVRDFLSLFSGQQKDKFKQVVTVDTPYGKLIGFITVSDLEKLASDFNGKSEIAVFLPFSYQMGGFTIIVPKESVTEIALTIEEALSFIATAGIVRNESLK